MAQDLVCRPIILRDIAFSIVLFGVTLKKNYSMNFYGGGPELLVIY